MVNTVGTRIIEALIDVLSRGNNMGGIMIGFNLLHFVPLDEGADEISPGV